jgi:hypothetical protein
MSGVSDDKYIVFKRSDFDGMVVDLSPTMTLLNLKDLAIEDAVVIRRQDYAAPHVLDAYGTFYTATAEILKEHGEEATAKRLIKIADYFHQQALMAWDTQRKLPD